MVVVDSGAPVVVGTAAVVVGALVDGSDVPRFSALPLESLHAAIRLVPTTMTTNSRFARNIAHLPIVSSRRIRCFERRVPENATLRHEIQMNPRATCFHDRPRFLSKPNRKIKGSSVTIEPENERTPPARAGSS